MPRRNEAIYSPPVTSGYAPKADLMAYEHESELNGGVCVACQEILGRPNALLYSLQATSHKGSIWHTLVTAATKD